MIRILMCALGLLTLTLFDGKVGHDKDDSVTREDVVTTVDMFTIDGETTP